MKNGIGFASGFAFIATLFCVQPSFGQGCIISRSNGEVGGPESEGGYLQPGQFDLVDGYRHQFSSRHFLGPREETYVSQIGIQQMNRINLQNYALTYQATSRFSVTADIPLIFASRHQNNTPVTYTSSGFGDASLIVNGWVWKPQENTKGNIQFGVGLLAPSGKTNVMNHVNFQDGRGAVPQVVDYSIQPGQGGWGIPFQWISFKNVGKTQLYFNGSYTAMLQSINLKTLRSGEAPNPLTLLQYNSISDQYLLEGGIAHAVPRVKGLTFTFGPRMEGVPARNLFPGDNLGFRRPGFAISVEPGLQYARGGSVLTAQVARAFYRDRTVSVTDALTGTHGDAAFADYVWLASYAYRFSAFHRTHAADHDHSMPDHNTADHNKTDTSSPDL